MAGTRGQPALLDVRQDSVEFVERVVADDHLALARGAVLDLHDSAQFFGQLVLQPLHVGIERFCVLGLTTTRGARQHAADQRLGLTDRQALFCHQGADFDLVPPVVGDYHVATDRPDQVLVAAPQHYFDIIPDTGFEQANFTGVDYMRIELDFIVG